jgi:hypothetical protein
MKITCVTSIKSVGCTFVDWSLHFLSNQSNYYNVAKKSSAPLVTSPLTSTNAHGHLKNHPAGLELTKQHIQQFQAQTNFDFCSMYTMPMHIDVAAKQLGIDQKDLADIKLWKKIVQHIVDDYQKLFNWCCTHEIGTVYIDPDPKFNLYFLSCRSLDRLMLSNRSAKNYLELENEFQNAFFQDTVTDWQNQGLNGIWDKRERLALNRGLFDRFEDQFHLDLSLPHLWVSATELWNYGVDTIQTIMKYLDLPIDAKRWNDWLPIHQQWHEIQQKNLKFVYQFDHIIDAIVNNYYYKLEKLSFVQEVAIQHALIYQHNLNLKTWQLVEFPSNTQEIHQLLESNIHPI